MLKDDGAQQTRIVPAKVVSCVLTVGAALTSAIGTSTVGAAAAADNTTTRLLLIAWNLRGAAPARSCVRWQCRASWERQVTPRTLVAAQVVGSDMLNSSLITMADKYKVAPSLYNSALSSPFRNPRSCGSPPRYR